MTVECIRCLKNGGGPMKWHATGRIVKSSRNLPRAVLKCDVCGFLFTSGVKEALDAAAAERGDCEVTPEAEPLETPVPQRVLPIGMQVAPKSQPLVTVGELAKVTKFGRFLDRKRAAGGDE